MGRALLLLPLLLGCIADTGELIPLTPPDPKRPMDPEDTATVAIGPSRIDFRSVPRGGRAESSILMVNHTFETVRVSWSLDPSPFVIPGSNEVELEAGQSKELAVVFAPSALGIYREPVDFTCGADCSATVELFGSAYDGVGSDEPLDCLDQMMITAVGSCVSAGVSCTNRAFSDLSISRSTLNGAPAFRLDGAQPETIAQNDWITYDVEFCPTLEGWFVTELEVHVLAVDGTEHVARALITGETPSEDPPPPPPPPDSIECSILPEPWTIGPIAVGDSTFWGVHCWTAIGADLRVTLNPPVPGTEVNVIAGQPEQFIVIRYEPEAPGRVDATLELQATDAFRMVPMVFLGE